jgi:hypothetical protein
MSSHGIQQLISQAVDAYDDNSFIRIDDSRREQPADNTCQPIHDPILDRGYNFEAMVVPDKTKTGLIMLLLVLSYMCLRGAQLLT